MVPSSSVAVELDQSFGDQLVIKPRKIPSQNIVHRLRDREMFGSSHRRAKKKNFYLHVFPNLTIFNVDTPLCYLRKFSPDGKYLVGISTTQSSLHVYRYLGPAAASDLTRACEDEVIDEEAGSSREKSDIPRLAFERVLQLKHVVHIVGSGEQLNRECSLYTQDSRYVIVGATAALIGDARPSFYNIYTNNESVVPNHHMPLEDYSIHLVDIFTGRICDTINFKVDKIYLGQNQGLCLYQDTLAVLSIQHQTIHIFQIQNSTFVPVTKIGRFCFEDDELVLASVFPEGPFSTRRTYRESIINGLKHRILVFLYRRAVDLSERAGTPYELRRFYQYFDQFRALRLWKMQFLDEEHLFLKYASESIVTLKSSEHSSQCLFFVIYNYKTAQVLAVYDNTSEELLQLFENFCYLFRCSMQPSQYPCTPSNNIYARQTVTRLKETIVRAQYGGIAEATRRLLAQLPICSQSYTCSPYMDQDLYSYDDKRISVLERPKNNCCETAIRFYGRESGILKFRMHGGIVKRAAPIANNRKLVSFTFHPTDPFVISIQRTSSESNVNFHVRHDPQP